MYEVYAYWNVAELEGMFKIMRRLVEACAPTPVTAKIRLGCSRDNVNCNEVARVVEEAAAAAGIGPRASPERLGSGQHSLAPGRAGVIGGKAMGRGWHIGQNGA